MKMPGKISGLTLLLGLCALGSACSNQQAYEAVQSNRLHECEKMPPTAAEKCRQQHSQSYEDYQRDREEALDKGY